MIDWAIMFRQLLWLLTNNTLVILCHLLHKIIAISIAQILAFFQVRTICNLFGQFHLGPAKLLDSPKTPNPGIHIQVGLHDNNILCPADLHRLSEDLRMAFIHPIKIPHPAQIARREADPVRIVCGDIFRSHHSGPLLRPAAHQPAQLQVQLHLGKASGEGLIDPGIKAAVIDVFPNVHMAPPFQRMALSPSKQGKEKRRTLSAQSCTFLWLVLQHLHDLLPQQDETAIKEPVVMIMTKQPVMEIGSCFDLLQKIR